MLTVKMEGLRALQDQLVALGVELGVKTLARAARRAFAPVLRDAKALVPVDTGLLRDSIKVSAKKVKSGDAVVVVGLRVAAAKGNKKALRTLTGQGKKGADRRAAQRRSAHWRWHFVELGTSTQAARPFLRPALDRNATSVVHLFKAELAKSIQRALRKKAKAAAAA